MAHLELDFYEYRPDIGMVIERVWYTARLPLSEAKERRDAGRPYVAINITSPAALSRIPCEGYLVITRVGEEGGRDQLTTIIYGGVPTVKSAEIEADEPSAEMIGRMARRGAHAMGLVRAGNKGCFVGRPDDEIENDFKGYTACPAETWVQIGKTSEPFVVQVKLQKAAPIDTERSLALGTFFIYHPARVVVTLPA
jgi:hypothetical protein